MRESDGVGPAQRHHFLNGESSGGELIDELRDRRRRKREAIGEEERRSRDARVAAAEGDLVVRSADRDEEIADGDGEDIGARDGVGASELESGFGADHDVEAVSGEREVDRGVAFRGDESGGGDEDGGVAAVGEAVVEEEAECGGGGCWGGDLFVGDGVADNVEESRA